MDLEREASASGLGVQAAADLPIVCVLRRLDPGVALGRGGARTGTEAEFDLGDAGAASDGK